MSEEGLFENRELPQDGNQTPQPVTDGIGFVTEFLGAYGWYLILGILGLLYLRSRYGSQMQQWQQKRQEKSSLSSYDAATVLSRQESLDRARQRMQSEHDSKTAEHAEIKRQKDEEKRQEQVADWERHQQGQGYRSKKLNKGESPQPVPRTGQNKPKKPSLRGAFNPMMSSSSSSSSSSSFRSSRARPGGGGGGGG